MANPIFTSEFFGEDEIKKMIEHFETLGKTAEDELKRIRMEARVLAKALNDVNVTQSDQREEIKKTATEANRMEAAYDKYVSVLKTQGLEMAKLKAAQRELNTINKLEAKLAREKEGSYNKLSAQYSLNKIKLNAMSKAQREATKEGRELVKQSADLYEEMKRLQEETGKHSLNVGNYKSALEGLNTPLNGVISNLQGFRDRLGAVRSGMVGSVQGLSGVTKGLKIFRIALASTGVGLLIIALGSLVSYFTRVQKGVDIVSDVMAGLGAAFDVILDRAAMLGSAIIKLFTGDFSGAVEDAKRSVSGLGDEIRNEVKEMVALTQTLRTLGRQHKELDVQTAQTRAQIKALNKDAEDTTLSFSKRAAAAQKAYDLEQALVKRRIYLIGQEIAGMQAKNDVANSLDADIEAVQAKEIERANLMTESLEMQTTIQNKLNAIKKEQASKAAADAAARAKEEEEALKAQEKKAAQIQQIRTIEEDAFAAASGGASQARLEYDRTLEKLKEVESQAVKLGIAFDPTAAQEVALKKFKEAVQKELFDGQDGIDNLPGRFQNAWEGVVLETEKSTKAVQDAIDDSAPKEPQNIFERMGINVPQGFQQSLQSALDFAKQQLSSFLTERTRIADQMVAAAEKELSASEKGVDAAQQAYNVQLQREQDGLANTLQASAERLSLAKAEEREAKAAQDRAIKNQEKAQKAQARLQSLEQVGNLVTATAKIWAQLGFPFAIPATAVMWGSFAAAKINAAKLAKKEYAEGGLEILGGGSHASGKDTPLGFSVGGRQAYGEKGEAVAVISRRQTARYKSILPDLINSLNSGTFENKFLQVAERSKQIPFFYTSNNNMDTGKMEDHLDAIRAQGQSKTYTDGNGRLIEQYKNMKIIYAG